MNGIPTTFYYIVAYLIYAALCAGLAGHIMKIKGYSDTGTIIVFTWLLGFIGVVAAAGMPLAENAIQKQPNPGESKSLKQYYADNPEKAPDNYHPSKEHLNNE